LAKKLKKTGASGKEYFSVFRWEGGGDVKAMQKFVIRINTVIHMH
jgi:hypothetical protein